MRISKTAFRIILSIFILLAIIVSTLFLEWPSSLAWGGSKVPTDECGPIEPTEKEVKRVMSIGKDAFASTDWVKNYTVEPYKISLTRRNNVEGALFIADYLMFNCGYGQEELDNLFGAEAFDAMLADYDSHTLANFCEKPGLSLYEYDLLFQGTEFLARFWVRQESDTRLLTVQLVFPKASLGPLEEYSEKLYPELTSCP